MNFRVREDVWRDALRAIRSAGDSFGRSNAGEGKRVLVEFVSANPTGPLHVGHGRGAVIGDVVSSLLDAAGYTVEREYYINDVGNQMRILGHVPQDAHLVSYIVDVILALYGVPRSVQQRTYNITDHRTSTMPNV